MLDRLTSILVVIGLGVSTFSCVRTARGTAASNDTGPSINQVQNTDAKTFLKKLPNKFEFPTDEAGELLLREYGAMFVSRNGVVHPTKIFFDDEADVRRFQALIEIESEKIAGINIELQKPAMRDLESAVKAARKLGLSISPRGVDSGRRGYNQTITLWKSRVEPGLVYWVGKRRIKAAEAARIRQLPIRQQIVEILTLEKEGIYFAKSLDKSIIYSVAPPGSSQHIAMLALDVKEFDDPRVRAVLADHGWFQTVVSDLPHFTYLGADESDLPGLGLKKVERNGRTFWVPDLPPGPLKPNKNQPKRS